jgi:hypothetical protein
MTKQYTRATWFRVTAAASAVAIGGLLAVTGTSLAAPHKAVATKAKTTTTVASCALGNGVKHVVEITFDNVHYFRDNPNVQSDLQLMPNLLNFIESNGTMLSNNHTPLIAHTANDILTSYTGLYGDRAGMPVSNSYQAYNADGTTDPAGSFAYWTDPVFDTKGTPNAGHDTHPSMVYSAVPPATAHRSVPPTAITPAPWAPFTRAGCNVGEVASANTVLENTKVDIPKVFGPGSPENNQLTADPSSFKDAESADYVGVAVHCATGAAFCATAKGVKFGQTTATPTASTDSLPSEPGGYTGYQGLFGHRYVAPQLGAGTANVTHNGYQVTNAAGNLVDLNGNQLNGAFLNNHPGFPGFDVTAPQTLGYASDMLESGVPVVYGYIADVHGNQGIPALSAACQNAPDALGSGTPCYIAQAKYYDAAFGKFFQRLAADGINASNTEFVFTADEGDHEAGANVGRAVAPTPAGCDGVTVPCTYASGAFGELAGNLTGLLATQKGDTTPLSLENDTAPEFYLTGNPGANSPVVRKVEHDVAGLTAVNPYAGGSQLITNYLASPVEEGILHMVNADPARTPTFAMFAKPDYYLFNGGTSCSGPCVTADNGFAWNHGDYAAEINTNWLGLVGPGVKHLGLDGQSPSSGPSSAGANSGQVTVVNSGTTGTWLDETDIRPTLMYLTGLRDDYKHDGRVVSQILSDPNRALSAPGVTQLAACYKQLNSSVGQFGAYTLIASTAAVESASLFDLKYRQVNQKLAGLEKQRDRVASLIKSQLDRAAFDGTPIPFPQLEVLACESVIQGAHALAG